MSLNSAYEARLVLPGANNDLYAEKWEGGELDSEEIKKRTASGRREVARGGTSSRSNVTLTFDCSPDMWARRSKLEELVLKNTRVTCVRQQLNDPEMGTALGAPYTVSGVLKSVKYPPYDLNGKDDGDVEIEISTDEISPATTTTTNPITSPDA